MNEGKTGGRPVKEFTSAHDSVAPDVPAEEMGNDEKKAWKHSRSALVKWRQAIADGNTENALESMKSIRKHLWDIRELSPSLMQEFDVLATALDLFLNPPSRDVELSMLKTLERCAVCFGDCGSALERRDFVGKLLEIVQREREDWRWFYRALSLLNHLYENGESELRGIIRTSVPIPPLAELYDLVNSLAGTAMSERLAENVLMSILRLVRQYSTCPLPPEEARIVWDLTSKISALKPGSTGRRSRKSGALEQSTRYTAMFKEIPWIISNMIKSKSLSTDQLNEALMVFLRKEMCFGESLSKEWCCRLWKQAIKAGQCHGLDLEHVYDIIDYNHGSLRKAACALLLTYIRHHPNHSEAIAQFIGTECNRPYLTLTKHRNDDFQTLKFCALLMFEIFKEPERNKDLQRNHEFLATAIDILRIDEKEYVVGGLEMVIQIFNQIIAAGTTADPDSGSDLFCLWMDSHYQDLFDSLAEHHDPEVDSRIHTILELTEQLERLFEATRDSETHT